MSQSKQVLVTSVLFPCPSPSYSINSFPGELVWVPKQPVANGAGDNSVPCLLLPYESARFLIMFFHSNAEDLGRCRWFCQFLREQFQCHVLAVEYPGYGICAGTVSREGIIENALAGLEFVTDTLQLPLEQVKIFGRSIGTGPALYLAAKFRVAGVVLVTPFLSVRDIFRDRVGPLSQLVEEWFPNNKAIEAVQSPTMIIHGQRDSIIPCRHGKELFNLCGCRKLFISPKTMDHNANLATSISYLTIPMFRFFSLPDYSFQELKVPAWAYEKRRSPFFRRPAVEVCSHEPQGMLHRSEPLCMPGGDEGEEGTDRGQDASWPWHEGTLELQGRAKSAAGDTPAEDYEENTVLGHPLVRHTFRATKRRYDFHGGGLADSGALPAQNGQARGHGGV